MKILSLSYNDNALKWSLDKVVFENLTLLVGASGVGKTQILNSIMKLKAIANGESISGVKWELEFETLDKHIFKWTGKFENKGDIRFMDDEDEEVKRNKPSILQERLLLDDKEIIKRENGDLFFEGTKTIKLSSQQSAIYLLKEEDFIKPAYEGFNQVVFSDQTNSKREAYRIRILDTQNLLKTHKTIRQIQESTEDIRIKLFLAYKNAPDIFETIKERYIDIFPQVEDVKVASLDDFGDFEGDISFFFKEIPLIQIKERGVDKWIKQQSISSGMFRSLTHIGEIYLCSEGTVFLIDEFENSLGINCINELTNDILASRRQIQFILTSHHPYIINNIELDNWKVVTRNKGIVRTQNAEELNLGNSKHSAFMQLLQLEEYQTGMQA